MTQGGIFKLVLRDERFDNFFTASEHLRTRFKSIHAQRKSSGKKNTMPTFIDIEQSHVLYVYKTYKPYVAVASEYIKVKASGDGISSIGLSGGVINFTFPTYGQFTNDIVIHVRFKNIGTKNPTNDTPYLRYCALPGVRMFKKIEFRSDQTVIDDYIPEDVIMNSKFFVGANQKAGWERCHGQQELQEAIYFGNNFTGSLMYRDGAQTPKYYHEELNLIIPLNFWFCKDASQALLNDMIPNSQRTITCELAPLHHIIQALIAIPANTNDLKPYPYPLTLTTIPFSKIEFEANVYVNNLYVNPEIHEMFASRIGFSLIRVHRRQIKMIQAAKDAFLLDQLKYPAEYLMLGFRSKRLVNDFDRWWMMGIPRVRNDFTYLSVPAYTWEPLVGLPVISALAALEVTTLNSFVDMIGITANGIEILPVMPSVFYNSYLPIRYAENSLVVSPTDTSAFLISFCLYPGKYNPSGYYNLSANRELYLNYTLKEDLIAPGESEMVISMSALNFIVRNGDKLTLRYSY
jgi:hypothetical protein